MGYNVSYMTCSIMKYDVVPHNTIENIIFNNMK